MKRISIDNYINMSIQELDNLMYDESNVGNNPNDPHNLDIDMGGLFLSDIVEKYKLLTIEEVKEKVKSKLNR